MSIARTVSSSASPAKAPKRRAGKRRAGTTVETIYAAVRSLITNFEIRPGERLNEQNLAQMLGVSRTPIREALNRLKAERVLDFEPNLGFHLRMLGPTEIRELYEFRALIETHGARLAVANASDEAILELERFWRDVISRADSSGPQEFIFADREFHARLMALSGQTVMADALNAIGMRIHALRWIYLHGDPGRSLHDEHEPIVAALRARDTELCAALLSAHILKVGNNMADSASSGFLSLFMRRDPHDASAPVSVPGRPLSIVK